MNLELLQTVDQSYPEHSDGILDSGSEALTCAFNRRGTLLAVGCNDGRIAIWDFMTRGIARMLNGHIHPITFLSWNRSGRKLLSSSTDWNVLLWDIASGEIDLRFRFPSPILKAQFHPRNNDVFLVCPMKNAPVVVRKKREEYKHTPLPTDGEPELNIVASFDRRGERIVTGSSKGKINSVVSSSAFWKKNEEKLERLWARVLVIDSSTLQILKSFKIGSASTSTAVKSIEFARRGSNFLVNSADRVIRVFDVEDMMKWEDGEVEALQKLQDLVNRTQWKKCSFSGDGEFIVAGSHRQHALYIWDKGTGSLVKMLTGQKGETLLDIVWHPVRPVILSISTGVVNIWCQTHVELWSAYAPNFKELDENLEYEEREDEFDIEDEDKVLGDGVEGEGGEEKGPDILTPQPIPAFCSSDEDDEEPLDWLPMAPEIEDPEEPGWGQLEPSLNELPAVDNSVSRKRPANDENVDPTNQGPPAKQPRTIEIDLPNHHDVTMETNQKETKVKSSKDNSSKPGKKSKSNSKSSFLKSQQPPTMEVEEAIQAAVNTPQVTRTANQLQEPLPAMDTEELADSKPESITSEDSKTAAEEPSSSMTEINTAVKETSSSVTDTTVEETSGSVLETDTAAEELSSSVADTAAEELSSSVPVADTAAEELSSSVPETDTAAEELSSSVADTAAEELSSSVPETDTAAEELSSSVPETDTAAEELSSSVPETDTAAEELSSSVPETDTAAKELSSSVPETDTAAEELSSSVPETDLDTAADEGSGGKMDVLLPVSTSPPSKDVDNES